MKEIFLYNLKLEKDEKKLLETVEELVDIKSTLQRSLEKANQELTIAYKKYNAASQRKDLFNIVIGLDNEEYEKWKESLPNEGN